jgi:hypothetical protein
MSLAIGSEDFLKRKRRREKKREKKEKKKGPQL